MKILALSGSLRAASSNSAILRLLTRFAEPAWSVETYSGLAQLPFFSPDLDRALDDPALPAEVLALRRSVQRANALVISCPEYAHGVPGAFKNALDWLVGGSEMPDKLVALYNTSPHATHAQASLEETLRTMSCRLAHDAFITIALPRDTADDKLVANAGVSSALRNSLGVLSRLVGGQ